MGCGRALINVILVVVLSLVSASYPAAARAAATAEQQCFAATNLCVDEPLLSYWREHGGLAINGYPITAPFEQRLENGTIYTVQYFERVRLEAHPAEYGAPAQILLGQFGRLLYPTDPKMPLAGSAKPRGGATYFAETGHNLAGLFRNYWEQSGGLAQFGYPISEEFTERLEDGKEYTVQYFERARFEHHPENPTPYTVLLGQFGRRIVAALSATLPVPVNNFNSIDALYRNDLGVRARLGSLLAPPGKEPIATLRFERGAMLYRASTRTIYVVAQYPDASQAVGIYQTYADTWQPGQDGGGGSAAPGLFTPKQGFGKVWREHEAVRQALGFATQSDEQTNELVALHFQGGLLIEVRDTIIPGPYGIDGGVFLLYSNDRFEFRPQASYFGV